jgi:hypothetical protein
MAFAQLICKNHTATTAENDFRESWLNHTCSREDAGVAVVHGIRLGTATASAAQRYGIQGVPAIDTRPMTALDAMMREQSLPSGGPEGHSDEEASAGKSRMNPASPLHPLIQLPQARQRLVSAKVTSSWLASAQPIILQQSKRPRRAWPALWSAVVRSRRRRRRSSVPTARQMLWRRRRPSMLRPLPPLPSHFFPISL